MLLVPRSALPPYPDQLFQPRPGFLYLDESGQMDADRRRPEAVEVQVIGGVMIPDSNSDRDILRVLVDELRRRVHGSETCRDEVKAKHLSSDDRHFLRRNFPSDWIVCHRAVRVTVKEVEAVHAGLVKFGEEHITRFRADLAEIGIDIGPLEEQYRAEVQRNPLCVWMLANIYDQTAKWFRQKSIRPRLTVYLDDKIPRKSRDLLQFLGRRFIYTAFPEVYRGERLFELFGGASADFNCSVRSDAEIDGLILADIFANAASRVERGDDPDGSYRRLLPPREPASGKYGVG